MSDDRLWLEQVEAAADAGGEVRVTVAWLAGGGVEIAADEVHAARRRALLLLAAGGDPRRSLELDGRAVTALAADLDRPVRRSALTDALTALRAEAGGLPEVSAAIEALISDGDLAWRAYAAALLAEELAEDDRL